jgi:hypothetical protein
MRNEQEIKISWWRILFKTAWTWITDTDTNSGDSKISAVNDNWESNLSPTTCGEYVDIHRVVW